MVIFSKSLGQLYGYTSFGFLQIQQLYRLRFQFIVKWTSLRIKYDTDTKQLPIFHRAKNMRSTVSKQEHFIWSPGELCLILLTKQVRKPLHFPPPIHQAPSATINCHFDRPEIRISHSLLGFLWNTEHLNTET